MRIIRSLTLHYYIMLIPHTNLCNSLLIFSHSGISSILFETRIGCLEKEIPAETQDFINSIAQMSTYNVHVVLLPNWTRNYLPFWQWYINGWEGIFKFGKLVRSNTSFG